MSKTIRSAVTMIDTRTVAGFVYDSAKSKRKLVVEILADDVPIAVVRAADFSPALAAAGHADPYHGFAHALGERLVATSTVVTVRLANLATMVGAPIDLAALPTPDPMLAAMGAIEHRDALVLTGWVKAAPGTATLLRATVAGEEVSATIARNWTSRTIGGEERPVLAFELKLPVQLADGEPHDVTVATAADVPLAGSPVRIELPARRQR